MSPETALRYVGQKFCNDNDLFSMYPDLRNAALKRQWQPGKTDWNDQCIMASEIIGRDLRKANILWSKFQVVDYERLKAPAVHRTAAIIYRGLGQAWFEYEQNATAAYNAEMKQGKFAIDLNRNAKVSEYEKRVNVIMGTR